MLNFERRKFWHNIHQNFAATTVLKSRIRISSLLFLETEKFYQKQFHFLKQYFTFSDSRKRFSCSQAFLFIGYFEYITSSSITIYHAYFVVSSSHLLKRLQVTTICSPRDTRHTFQNVLANGILLSKSYKGFHAFSNKWDVNGCALLIPAFCNTTVGRSAWNKTYLCRKRTDWKVMTFVATAVDDI